MGALSQHVSSPVYGGGAAVSGGGDDASSPPSAYSHSPRTRGEKENSDA
jgi:hypothetical protein